MTPAIAVIIGFICVALAVFSGVGLLIIAIECLLERSGRE